MKNLLLYLACCVLIIPRVFSQSTTNYAIDAGNTRSLTTMTGSTTLIGANQSLVSSTLTNLGFEMWFMGQRFTQFSVNCNGSIQLGAVILTNGNAPNIAGAARIIPFANGIETDTRQWRTSNTGRVHYLLRGTAPNRILTIEWLNVSFEGNSTSADATFQANLYETSPNNTNGGGIDFVYGSMTFTTTSSAATCAANQSVIFCGFGNGTATDRFIYMRTTRHPNVALAGTDFSTSTIFGSCYSSGALNISNATDPNRRFYTFTSPIPNGNVSGLTASCVSSSSIRLNWTEAANNEVGIVIYRSTDGINYNFMTQLPANTLTFTDTGLAANTTYYYRVYTVTEGKLSATTAGNTVNITTLTAGTVYSITTGNWNSGSTWSTGVVPTATDNVVIGCPTGHTVTVNSTTATCNNLTILANSNVTIASSQLLTVRGNLVVNDGGALPKITMISTNPTLELRGHWIDLDQTNVAAGSNGILDPGTSSTVTLGGAANQIINANNINPTLNTIQSTKPMIFHNLIINGDDVDLIYNDNKPIVINNDLTVNANKRFTYNLNMVAGGVGNIDLKGNMINNGTIYSRNDGRHFLMSGASKTITGTGIYTNFPLQIANGASVALNTNATMRALWVLSGGTFTVQNTPRTYTLTRSAVGNTNVELRNQGTFNYSGANIVLGTSLDATATANLINTGTWNAGTGSNFTFSGAGSQTVSNTGVPIPAGTSTFTAPAYTTAVAITDNRTGFVAFGATLVTPPTEANLITNGAVAMPITVPAGTYTALTSIAFNITQTFNADLEIYLVAPDGTTFEISTDNGGIVGGGYVGVIVNNTGGNFPTGDTNPITGTFRPEGALFSTYGGALAGTWKLYVLDDGSGDTGSIQNFTLNLGNATFNAGTGVILDNIPASGIATGNTIPTATQLFNSGGAFASATVTAGTYSSLASINFSISHNENDNLDIYLLAPDNKVYVISTDNGGNGDDYTNVTVNDGGTAFPTGNTNISGTRVYEVGATGAATFALYPAASLVGIWRLYVFDDEGGTVGSITNFSITLNTPAQPVMLTFHNLIMNNTSSTGATLLDTQITINNQTTFTNGRLYTSEAYRVNYIAGAATSFANSNSYIEGWARKIGNTTFEFPLGGGGFAAPIRFTPTSGSAVTDHFTATYRRITPNTGSPADNGNVNTTPFNNVAPYPIANKQASINHVSNVEYWILERTNGAAQGTVHLSYNDMRSGGAGVPADLLVCRWNSGTPIWENKGNGGTSAAGGFTYVQSTAGSFTAFSPVTLGSTTRFNVLPVAWLDFTVKKVGTTAELAWKTQEDGKNQGFEIERSIDGQNFRTIGTQAPQTKVGLGSYVFTDKSLHEVAVRVVYYRIKQVDTDGVTTYSKVESILNDAPALFMANIFPNPFANVFMVEIVSEEELTFAVSLVDMLGKNVKALTLPCKKGINTFTIPANELPQGVYLLRLQTNERQISYKVVKE